MLSYSYLPSKGLAVFHKWEGSQAQKAGEVQLSKQTPPSPVRPRPSRIQWQGKQFPLPHRHNPVRATATCLVKAITTAKKAHFHTAKNTE